MANASHKGMGTKNGVTFVGDTSRTLSIRMTSRM
jgi:hypothetical protein